MYNKKFLLFIIIIFLANCTKVFACNNGDYKKIASKSVNKSELQQDFSVQYPVIDEIEKKILNKVFSNEDITKRLDRLELAIFKKNFKDSLSSRVDRLKTIVFGNQDNTDNSAQQMDSASVDTILSHLEKQTFNTTYDNETEESRLDRLENQVFNQTSPDDSVNDRVERLAAVVTAQPSSQEYNDMAKVRKYQSFSSKVSAAAILLMLIRGLLF